MVHWPHIRFFPSPSHNHHHRKPYSPQGGDVSRGSGAAGPKSEVECVLYGALCLVEENCCVLSGVLLLFLLVSSARVLRDLRHVGGSGVYIHPRGFLFARPVRGIRTSTINHDYLPSLWQELTRSGRHFGTSKRLSQFAVSLARRRGICRELYVVWFLSELK